MPRNDNLHSRSRLVPARRLPDAKHSHRLHLLHLSRSNSWISLFPVRTRTNLHIYPPQRLYHYNRHYPVAHA